MFFLVKKSSRSVAFVDEVESDKVMCESRTLDLGQARDRCVTQKILIYITLWLQSNKPFYCSNPTVSLPTVSQRTIDYILTMVDLHA